MLRNQFEIKEWARKLIRELNLMKRDSLEAELDSTAAWRFMVDPNALLKMHKDYEPIEAALYAAAAKIVASDNSMLTAAKAALIVAVKDLKGKFYTRNAQLLRDLGTAVSKLPDNVIQGEVSA